MGKKLTNEEFIRRVMEKNEHVRNGEIEIRGNLVNTSERIECYCTKHNVTWNPIADSLYKGIGCRECAKEGISEKNSKSHDNFVKELYDRNKDIIVMSQYNGMYEDITVKLKCGHMWTTHATNVFNRDFGCPYCSGNAILIGFNDLWTTSPSIASLLTNPEDGYSVMKGSGKKKNFTCPLCGKSQSKFVANVVRRGLQCSYCGDGISFPNKFGRAFLKQAVGDNYTPEYNEEWCKPYKYDNFFYYNGKDYFLEMDGWFHYREDAMSDLSLEERQEIDRMKDLLAREHNIHMIRIDSVESNCEYIKNNMINSELRNIFDLAKIDWKECDKQAQKSLVKEACDLYMSGITNTGEIAQIMKHARGTIIIYLKKGAEFGWCDYNPKKSRIGMQQKSLRKPIFAENIKTGERYYFDSVTLCVNTILSVCGVKISKKSIHDSLKTGKSCKGFIFRYANSTIQN